ncbi:uncharacterized protein LOC135848031 [Planococcus citri]|uniref:uncharacterized protein LOC135848031 n=1 Tax=Planococcus citri TaxID=170843 RepID=UPI0031F76549
MKNNIIWSVFSIASSLSLVYCSPVAESGHTNTSNGYKLEIISKNDPNSGPINSKGFLDKLDFSALYNTVVKDVVPALLQTHEKGSPAGKETKHQLSTSITESLTKVRAQHFNIFIRKFGNVT